MSLSHEIHPLPAGPVLSGSASCKRCQDRPATVAVYGYRPSRRGGHAPFRIGHYCDDCADAVVQRADGQTPDTQTSLGSSRD